MKKAKLLTSLAAFVLILGLGACSEADDEILEDDGAIVDTDDGDLDSSSGSDSNTPSEHTHEYEITDSKDATCLEDGYITYTCKDGDDTYTVTIDALGHDWSDWVTTIEPTDNTAGQRTRTCSRCNTSETELIDATNHVLEDKYDSEYHWKECAVCGYTTDKESHTLNYSKSNLDHYHIVSCECGYSLEEVHQVQSETNSTCLCGEELTTDNFDYIFDSDRGGYLIKEWAASMDDPGETELYLPNEHTGSEGTYPVVGIADGNTYESSMRDFYNLEFIAFPDSFTYIGNYAFTSLTTLEVIAFSGNSNLETIGEYAFAYTKVSKAYLTSDHVNIGEYAFYTLHSQNCKISIVLGPYGHIGYGAFNEDDVTFFYRGTSDQWRVDLTLDDNALSGADYVRYNLGEWEFVDGVATPTK